MCGFCPERKVSALEVSGSAAMSPATGHGSIRHVEMPPVSCRRSRRISSRHGLSELWESPEPHLSLEVTKCHAGNLTKRAGLLPTLGARFRR